MFDSSLAALPYSHHPAYLSADNITLLCDECGTHSGEPITVQWKQVREPTNLRCTKCETGMTPL